MSAAGCQVLDLLVGAGNLAGGLLKLLDPVYQAVVFLLQVLTTGCRMFCLLIELGNLLRDCLDISPGLVEAAVWILETPILDQPFFLRSSH